jgi:hypothetical protein
MGQRAVQFPHVADGDRLGRRVPLALDGVPRVTAGEEAE